MRPTLPATSANSDVPNRPAWFQQKPVRSLFLREKPPRRQEPWKAGASVSVLLHAVLLLMFGLLLIHSQAEPRLDTVLVAIFGHEDQSDEGFAIDTVTDDLNPADSAAAEIAPDSLLLTSGQPVEISADKLSLDEALRTPDETSEAPPTPAPSTAKRGGSRKSGAEAAGGAPVIDDHFSGRRGVMKAALIRQMGGTPESEEAVARGLAWLKRHQRPDGSWSFDHRHSLDCDCSLPGQLANCPNGATAMALLAFLGAGHTHVDDGPYQTVVQQGLDYLKSHGSRPGKGICFATNPAGHDSYYTHGLATIALAEALAMSGDDGLRASVEGAIEYVSSTQHSGGGWRYFPGQPGDTSVVAWQVMGMKSAQFSRVAVSGKVLRNVDKFLNSVQSHGASQYGYVPGRQSTPSMTAAGLLCRMYRGWGADTTAIKSGVRYLSDLGPSSYDMYYNYYATQVLHHAGGTEWERWNEVLRDNLVYAQIRGGHSDGSWDVVDPHGASGGRLYMTSLCILTLEVYYRHMPLYQRERLEFPLTGAPDTTEPAAVR